MGLILKKLVFIFITSLILSSCMQDDALKNVNDTILRIKQKHAPDKRVAIFNLTPVIEGNKIILYGESNIEEGISDLMNELQKEQYKVENQVTILPSEELGDKIYGIVNLSVANIRSKPSHPAELATQSLLGTCLNVLKEDNGWYQVQTPDMYISWVDREGIILVNEAEKQSWKQSEKVIVTAQHTTAYSGPSSLSPVVSDMVMGNLAKGVSKSFPFTEIEFPDGRRCFVRNEDIQNYRQWLNFNEASQNRIINYANDFMGLPYLWGGTSTKGVDCSGFSKMVYYMNGVILPRDASQQVNIGRLINTENDFSNLEKGDLLFFGFRENEESKERITHVAIYLGDLKYIHSSGMVKINSFDQNDENFDKFRYDTFIRAKRIIGHFDRGNNLLAKNSFYN